MSLFYLQRYQKLLDDLVPHTAIRWTATAAVVVAYVLRVLWLQGWYIVSYALAAKSSPKIINDQTMLGLRVKTTVDLDR